jgi:NADH:ubiquinone reductase (H+-translocating)
VKPNAVIVTLPLEKEKGRLRVDQYLSVPGVSGLWAAGDCAAVPDGNKGTFHPPTAQHGSREGLAAAKNIERAILGLPLEPFRYRTMGLLATIGHRSAVAMIFGLKFSGLTAWWLWRTIYLAKLPGLLKKLRVTMSWTLDLFFGRDIEQIITLRDVEALSDRLALTQRNRLSLDGR